MLSAHLCQPVPICPTVLYLMVPIPYVSHPGHIMNEILLLHQPLYHDVGGAPSSVMSWMLQGHQCLPLLLQLATLHRNALPYQSSTHLNQITENTIGGTFIIIPRASLTTR